MTTEQPSQWTPPKRWRWMPSMTAICRESGERATCIHVLSAETLVLARLRWTESRVVGVSHVIPDRECPATLGCMLALARELWQDPALLAQPRWCNGQWRWVILGGKFHGNRFSRMAKQLRPTEFDALAAAIDGAP